MMILKIQNNKKMRKKYYKEYLNIKINIQRLIRFHSFFYIKILID